jgi:hypothetical protein
MFLLAGLYQPGGYNFIRWQLAITYFGAGLNKALDADWHSGVFFENWAVNRLQQPWYIALDSKLPQLVLAKLMCWSTIVTELGTAPCLLIPSLQYWAVLANIFFQSSLLLFTGTTFTLFFYSMTAASFAFYTWPEDPVPVLYDAGRQMTQRVKSFFGVWDLDRILRWLPQGSPEAAGYPVPSSGARSPLILLVGQRVYTGFRALRMMILLSPLTYFVIAGSIALFGDFPAPQAAFFRRLIAAVSLVLLMPPLAWIADMLTSGPESHAKPAPTTPAGFHVTGAGKK